MHYPPSAEIPVDSAPACSRSNPSQLGILNHKDKNLSSRFIHYPNPKKAQKKWRPAALQSLALGFRP
jgi:hypothetical protein